MSGLVGWCGVLRLAKTRGWPKLGYPTYLTLEFGAVSVVETVVRLSYANSVVVSSAFNPGFETTAIASTGYLFAATVDSGESSVGNNRVVPALF